MMNTSLWRRASRSFRLHRTPHLPSDGILVVEHEFEGGPLAGRRMTGYASTFDIHVERSRFGGRARLAARGESRSCIGCYRFARRYDCAHTLERVHVYRWCPRAADAGSTDAAGSRARASTASERRPFRFMVVLGEGRVI
jgi:hypothetical protein